MQEYRNVTFGCDPELFGVDKDTGRARSVHEFLLGTKSNPHPVDSGSVQVDGTAAEFGIDPVTNEEDWTRSIGKVTAALQEMCDPHGIRLSAHPTQIYEASYWKQLPLQATEMGCEPDFNAWEDGDKNLPPEPIVCMTAGGGHIHIGFDMTGVEEGDAIHEYLSHQLVRQFDAVLGLASFAWDTDTRRRALYGKAGAFRLKPYGVEYRTLSNAWVRSERLQRHVFRLANFAISRLNRGILYENILGDLPQKLINEADAERALRISSNMLKGKFDDAIRINRGRSSVSV